MKPQGIELDPAERHRGHHAMTTLTNPTAMTCTTSGIALHQDGARAHNGQMPKRDSARKTISVRITKVTAERMQSFLRDYSGKPLYLKPGEFVEKAIIREIQRLEIILSGALPMDDDQQTMVSATPQKSKKPGGRLIRLNLARSPLLTQGDDDRPR